MTESYRRLREELSTSNIFIEFKMIKLKLELEEVTFRILSGEGDGLIDLIF